MPSELAFPVVFPVVNDKGNRLLEVVSAEEASLDSVFLALMIAKLEDKFLLVHNAWRKCWEIPGGIVEPTETPRAAAVREFFEESSQTAENVRFLGRIRVDEPAKDRVIVGAVFACDLARLAPFTPNDEIEAVALWPGGGLELDAIDRALLSCYV